MNMFASGKSNHWRKLDNTAKIFPATSNKKDTRVFRVYCQLKEKVDEEFLQRALDKTLLKYPLFLSVMRKGFFWFYLEKTDIKPVVHEENSAPCTNLYIRDSKTLLFEVTYYENKISFEVFHALTDGTGAQEFTKELVKNYLVMVHGLDDESDGNKVEGESQKLENKDITNSLSGRLSENAMVNRDEYITEADYETDSFDKYYSDKHVRKADKALKTCQLKGFHNEYGQMKINEGVYSTSEVIKKAKELGVSITVFITSVFMCAVNEEISEKQRKRPVGVMVPVNLRQYFRSDSMLNFFGWISPTHKFSKAGESVESVVGEVSEFFARELDKERVASRMSSFIKMEKNPLLRVIPLEVKTLSMKIAANMSTSENTVIFSNIGIIKMPENIEGYIENFGFFTSTPKIQLCMCSYKDDMVMSFTSAFGTTNVERNFFRLMDDMGLSRTKEPAKYPEKIKPIYEGLSFFKYFSFSVIIAVILTIVVNLMFTPKLHWAVFVALGAFSMWLATAMTYMKRKNLLKNAIWQQILVPTVCILWDYYTNWKGWSVDFVFPLVSIVILFSMIIITKVQKLNPKDYIIYYLMQGIIGIVPYILLLCGVATVRYPSVLSMGCSLILIVSILFFKGKEMKTELEKKFHI